MHVTAKPSSFQCNLKCDYCFYLEKESQFTHEKWMDDSTLKEFIKQYIAASGNQVYFTWQGGEPTLAGLDFFRKVIHYQQRYAGQKRIFNALQTNGILLNNEWCAFLKEHEFLVGISIDGPQELHDRYRRSNSGNGTFAKVIAAIERLKSYQVEFNTLTVINNVNVHYPLEVYHFLKSIGSKHMQFIELLETGTPNIDFSGHSENTFGIIDFSVPPTAYGKFMSTIFMQWVKNDVGEIFIRQFESFVSRFLGNGHTSCIFQESCKDNLVVESNGDIYECDHFVYPQYKIGNINKSELKTMNSVQLTAQKKRIPAKCQQCAYKPICNGGCPKHRIAWAKLRTTVGWDHISDYTRHDHDIWYTELSCTYGDITGRCTRGGLGHISQAVDNYTFKTRLDWQKFAVGNVSHQPYFGAEYIYSDAWTERHNQSESYVINAAGKKTNHTIYHKGKGRLGIDNYTLYMADRISWRNVSLMPGVRYDYDNYLSNHNISPRFMTEWDIFANQTSMITAGYNRYYGGNILDMGLRDIRNSWTESVSGNKTLTRYQDLKTPYNDELAMGLQQKIGKNVIARANYVYREAHDQISKSSRTDSATKTTITEYNNDGKTKTHSFSLSFELAEPLHIRQVDINPQIVFSYIKSKGNLSLNNGYEESNTGDNQVVYNGNLVSYDSVPVADFNNPLKISLNMDFTHQPSGLVWANTLAWQEARKARIILGKTNAQYISEYSDYKQYVDEKLDSSLTWDTRLSWTPQFLKQQNLTISADILNVLDSKTAVDTTNTGVATYASGRTFWLDVSMKF